MARNRSKATCVLIVICMLLFPCMALAFASRPPDTPPSISLIPGSNFEGLTEVHPQVAAMNTNMIHPILDYNDPRSAADANDVLWAIQSLENPQLRENVHEVTVQGWGSLTNFTNLSLGLQSITRLDELHWNNNDPIPSSVLSTVEASHPSCKIFYNMKFSNWDRYDRTVSPIQPIGDEPHRDIRSKTRRLILNSTSLYSLTVHVEYGSQPDAESLPLVHEILTTCPNLRHLDLSVEHGGCVIGWPQPFAFDLAGTSRLSQASFAPLETLRLSGHRLSESLDGGGKLAPNFYQIDRDEFKWPWHYLPTSVLAGLPPHWLYSMKDLDKPRVHPPSPDSPITLAKKINLDGWIERMDFSKLSKLDLDGISPAILHKLRPVLTNLTFFSIHCGGSCNAAALETFLAGSRSPLQHLHLCRVRLASFDKLLDIISAQHNRSLKTLHLYGNRGYLNTSQLQDLQQSSPSIQSLDIDMDRNMTVAEHTSLFDTLALFQNISNLTLRVVSPSYQARCGANCTDRLGDLSEPLHDPLVNQTWASKVLNHIRGAQLNGTSADENPRDINVAAKLGSLEVIVGPWSTHSESSMIGPESLILGRFHCTVKPARTVEPLGLPVDGDKATVEECYGRLQWSDYWAEDDYEADFDDYSYGGDEIEV